VNELRRTAVDRAAAVGLAGMGRTRVVREHRRGPGSIRAGRLVNPVLAGSVLADRGLDKARFYAIAIDATRGLIVDLVAVAGSEEDAKPVANTLQALITLGQNAVQGIRQDVRDPDAANGEAMDWIVEAADSLLNGARLETSEGYVHLQAKSFVDLAGGVKLLVPDATAANTASRRKLSVNNLKQIALAFHNYHSANNQFPAPRTSPST
jgi:Protein of unknown function (DUF1559)